MWRMCLLVTCNLYHKLSINFWTTGQKGQFINFAEGLSWPVITALPRLSHWRAPGCWSQTGQDSALKAAVQTLLSLKEPLLCTRLGKTKQCWQTWGDIALQTWPDVPRVRSGQNRTPDACKGLSRLLGSKTGKVNDDYFLSSPRTRTLQKRMLRIFTLQGCFLTFIKLSAKTEGLFFSPPKVNI